MKTVVGLTHDIGHFFSGKAFESEVCYQHTSIQITQHEEKWWV